MPMMHKLHCLLLATSAVLALSTSVAAADPDSLPRYRPQTQITDTLRTWGSADMAELLQAWQKDFARHHPQVRYSNTLKGTETAQAALYTDVADFALMDREILTLERHVMLRRKHAYPLEIAVATGSDTRADRSPALAIFVHKDNPLASLSMQQVDGVFGEQRTGAWDDEFRWIAERGRSEQGNVRTWGQLGLTGEWAGKQIQTYGYPVTNYSPRPGPMLSFRRAAFGGGDMWNANLAEHESGREITAALARDRYGIAYAPLADANSSVRAIALAGKADGKPIALTQQSVASREYPLTRTVYISVAPDEPPPARVREFMRYVLSRDGQAVAAKHGGYLPLPADLARQQLQKLETTVEIKGPFARPMRLTWIPAGTFTMGTPASETGHRNNESPQTQVTLSNGYWMGTHEVTHGQWKALMGTDMVDQARLAQTDDSVFHLGAGSMPLRDYFRLKRDGDTMQLVGSLDDDVPMLWVSWDEANKFARKLTELARAQGLLPAGYEFRLPTEAEWEYAARAGTTGATYAGELVLNADKSAAVMDEIAWYAGTASDGYQGRGIDTSKWITNKEGAAGIAGPRTVGTKQPNAWGLYDMLGNAAEWCVDWDGPLPGGSVHDWRGAASSTKGHIRRGGGWSTFAVNARSGYRNAHEANFRWVNLGFRLVLARPL